MKINMQLGNSLSQTAKVPASVKRMLTDPYAEDKSHRWIWGVVVVLLLVTVTWRLGWVNAMLPESLHYGYEAPVVMDVLNMEVAP